mgnify:CR=1 FL=1
MPAFTESIVEDAALACLEALGYAVLHGPDIAVGELLAERSDPNYRDVVLERRLREPSSRAAAFRQVADSAHPWLGLVINRVLHGDDATIAYIADLAKSTRRETVNDAGLYALMGPRLTANTRV